MFTAWKSLWVTPDVYWELLVTVLALLVAGAVKRVFQSRLQPQEGHWHLIAQRLQRVFFPVIGLFGVLLGRGVLEHLGSVTLLQRLVIPVLLAFAVIRLVTYVLHRVFAGAAWVQRPEKVVFTVVWLGLLLHLSGLLPQTINALDEIGFDVGKHHFSVWLLLEAAITLIATLLGALWLGSLLEKRVMQSEALDMNLRVVLARSIRAVLVLAGILIALPMVGIDLTALSVFSGALGVGLGFGLQKIAANFVAGFIILLDRSIRIGDSIEIGDKRGIVQRMTSRYLVLQTGKTGPATIIPTETVISSVVVNNSYAVARIQVAINVRIAFDADLAAAERILVAAAVAQARVLRDPQPAVMFKSFGDFGLELELDVWIADPENGDGGLRNEINRAILLGFRREGITIPYPTRDVRMHPPTGS